LYTPTNDVLRHVTAKCAGFVGKFVGKIQKMKLNIRNDEKPPDFRATNLLSKHAKKARTKRYGGVPNACTNQNGFELNFRTQLMNKCKVHKSGGRVQTKNIHFGLRTQSEVINKNTNSRPTHLANYQK
jgi:hypothetical protein